MSESRAFRILVIQPDPIGDLDRFADWLEGEGTTFEVVRPYDGDTVPDEVAADGLIVLGGSMGAMDAGEFPWLTQVANLMKTAIAADTPTLGICLGAQILADAMGGEVRRGERGLESGVTEINWLDGADADPLMAGLPAPLFAGSMHFDEIVTLPPGSVHLGTGSQYENQVFRIGSAWGVQFHPEISPERFRSWKAEVVAEVPEISDEFDDQVAALERADNEVLEGTRALATRFAHIVRNSASE